MELVLGGARAVLLALFVLLYRTPAAIARECPSQSIAVGHLCISHVSTTKSSFGDAQKFCRDQDSALVLPLTQLQNQDLTNFGTTTINDEIWINLNDQQVDSKFMMESGYGIDTEFFSLNWGMGQPELSTTKNCVSLRPLDGRFYTDTCGNLKHFMCEKKKMICKLPYIAHDNMCLTTLPPAARTGDIAKADCAQAGGFVPHAFNLDDNKLFQSYVQSRFYLNGDPSWFGPMLGAYRDGNTFFNPFNQTALVYMNWSPGEPSELYEHCTVATYGASSTTFKTVDVVCSKVSSARLLFCQRAAECVIPYGTAAFNSTTREVKVACKRDYVLKTDHPTYCGIDGLIATDFDDICELQTCDHNQISNGKAVYSTKASRMPGTIRQFVCNAGYQLNETSKNECVASTESKGYWNGNTPVCQKSCGTTPVEHGTVQYSDGAGHHGSQMTITCEPGYSSSIVTTNCVNGVWENELGCTGESNRRCPSHIPVPETIYVGNSCYWITQTTGTWQGGFQSCIADGGVLAPAIGFDLWQYRLFPFIRQRNALLWINVQRISDVNYEFGTPTTQKRVSMYIPPLAGVTLGSNGCFVSTTHETVALKPCSFYMRALCVKDQPWAKYKTKKDMRMVSTAVMTSTVANSVIRCGMECTSMPDCLGVNFNSVSNECQLLDRKYLDNEDLLEAGLGWEVAYVMY